MKSVIQDIHMKKLATITRINLEMITQSHAKAKLVLHA